MPSVFLSHNHKDKPAVRQVARRLIEHGVKVWIDEAEMDVGDNIIDKISIVTKEADYVLVFLSENSVHSAWVKTELRMAMEDELQDGNTKVLAIKLDTAEWPDSIRYLKTKVYCNFSDPSIYEQEFARLLRTLGINVGLVATLNNLLLFDFLDMVVLESEIFILAKLLTGTGHFKQDSDGTKKFESHIYLIHIEVSGTMRSFQFSRDLCVGQGALAVSSSHVRCFINYKVTDGTYAMNGSLYVIRRQNLEVQYVKEVFANENWGWFPMVFDADNVQHFSYDNYHKCLNNTKGEKILPSEFDILQVKHVMKHSKGWFPDHKEKVLQKITSFISR